jgi:hypothetical protein
MLMKRQIMNRTTLHSHLTFLFQRRATTMKKKVIIIVKNWLMNHKREIEKKTRKI